MTMRTIEAELVVAARPEHGEGPVWHEATQTLVWLDILGGVVHSYDPTEDVDREFPVGQMVGAAAPTTNGAMVLVIQDGLAIVTPNREVEVIDPIGDGDVGVRFNEGKCDPSGRLWAGTMARDEAPERGALYRIGTDGAPHKVLGDLTISNGMAWSSDRTTMYFIDSITSRVDAFDYDDVDGSIGARRPVVDLHDSLPSLPDGMTIDADDHLWVAMFRAGEVRRFSPTGELVQVVTLPVTNVTSCAFGGSDYRDLYITTTHQLLSDEEKARQPLAGSLFRCRPGAVGLPADAYAGPIPDHATAL